MGMALRIRERARESSIFGSISNISAPPRKI